MKTRTGYGWVWVLALPLALGAPSAQGADLLEVYRLAERHDAAFAAARAALEAEQERLPQARAELLPNLSLQANTTYNYNRTEYDEPAGGVVGRTAGTYKYNSHGYGAVLEQPLFDAQLFAFYGRAKAEVAQAAVRFAAARQDLIRRVAEAYFGVLLAQENLATAEAETRALSRQLAQIRAQFEAGTVTITDVNDAQARRDLAQSAEIAARQALEIERQRLARIVGTSVEALAPLGRELPLEAPEPDRMAAWVERAQGHNLQILANQLGVRIADQTHRAARAARWPDLSLVAEYQKLDAQSFGGVEDTTTDAAIGLQVTVPLYEGGAIRSRARQAASREREARFTLEDTRRAASLETQQAYLDVTAGLAQIRALRQALRSSDVSLASTRRGYEVGVRTSVDVLDALQRRYQAQRDLSQAQYDYLLSLLALQQAVGDLEESDVARINRFLAQPETAPADEE